MKILILFVKKEIIDIVYLFFASMKSGRGTSNKTVGNWTYSIINLTAMTSPASQTMAASM